MNNVLAVAALTGLFLVAISPARALPIYLKADFSGGVSTVTGLGNSLGLQLTNTCSGCAAGSVEGHLLLDQSLVPGSGTGTVNIALTSVTGVSKNDIFDIMFGSSPLGFEFGDPNVLGGPSVQFKNGVFNGFFLVEDFAVNGKSYELSMQGSTWTINWLKNNNSSDLVASGYLSVGAQGLTNRESNGTIPPQLGVTAVPEPTSLALFAAGLLGFVMTRGKINRNGDNARGPRISSTTPAAAIYSSPLYTDRADRRW